MKDFTELVNAGQQSYVDKHTKKRMFGVCFGCEEYNLLITAFFEEADAELDVCERCYNKANIGKI